MRLSEKIANVEESGTVKFTPLINRLQQKGFERMEKIL